MPSLSLPKRVFTTRNTSKAARAKNRDNSHVNKNSQLLDVSTSSKDDEETETACDNQNPSQNAAAAGLNEESARVADLPAVDSLSSLKLEYSENSEDFIARAIKEAKQKGAEDDDIDEGDENEESKLQQEAFRKQVKMSQASKEGAGGYNEGRNALMAAASAPSASGSKSSFRLREEATTKSMRVVRFSKNKIRDDEDTASAGGGDGVLIPENIHTAATRPSKQQQQHSHSNHSHSNKRSATQSHVARHRHSAGAMQQPDPADNKSWMTQLAYSFRSPPVGNVRRKQFHHHDDTRRKHNHHHSSSANNKSNTHKQPSSTGSKSKRQSEWRQEGGGASSKDNHPHRTPLSPTPEHFEHLGEGGENLPLLPQSRPADPQNARGLYDKELSASADSPRTRYSRDYVGIAAAFLQDYERNRPPSLPPYVDSITEEQLDLYKLKFTGVLYPLIQASATLSLFISSFLEGFNQRSDYRFILSTLNVFALAFFATDMWIRSDLHGTDQILKMASQTGLGLGHYHRTSRADRLLKPMALFCIVLGLENLARLLVTDESIVMFSSILKPLVLYYVSSRARDALEALGRIYRTVTRVILVELLLILMFAAVACRLFNDYDRFQNLSTSWLSLFELSTTVVNPSIWMPMYEDSRFSAIFFVFFVVTSVFYLHSLVLSVVFQTYIHAATEVHQRSIKDREETVRLAHLALQFQQQLQRKNSAPLQQTKQDQQGTMTTTAQPPSSSEIDVQLIHATLRQVRPHYSDLKINALVEIVAPAGQNYVDFATFRTKIRAALGASIRTARNATTLALVVELIAVAVAAVNFVYVILVSSDFSEDWFESYQELIGCIITLVALFELAVRFNPLRIRDFTPLARLNATFDGLALVAALTSCIGMVLVVLDHASALDYILMGRAIDMMRVLRFFQIFRDVVRRSADVMPALIGPIILVMTTLHLFVYLGMALWGDAIEVGTHGGVVTYLYDLNNFNSYHEGIVTLFQVLVVNDWHAIAEVFLYADRCSSPYIVYPFFIFGNLVGVSIMLNLLTAFFVESFVTKLNDEQQDGSSDNNTADSTVSRDRDFSIRTSENTSVRRIASLGSLSTQGSPSVRDSAAAGNEKTLNSNKKSKGNDEGKVAPSSDPGSDHDADADSEGSSESALYEFDVFQREGFDTIIQTVAGTPSPNGDFARQVCNYLETFESLCPGREPVGYLVCDQQTMDRFGNRRFRAMAIGFLEDTEQHAIVSDMHVELLALASRVTFQDRSLIRRFSHKSDPNQFLEISASLLRRQPALSLFVSRQITDSSDNSMVGVTLVS